MKLNVTYSGNFFYFSDYKDSSIRLNIYPTATSERLVTANCVPVQKPNNLAENGIVHVIDGVITPGQYSIKQIIDESKKLTMLRKSKTETLNNRQH